MILLLCHALFLYHDYYDHDHDYNYDHGAER